MVPYGSRVLDLGCGDGALLAFLQQHHGCSGYGVEINDANVLACVKQGVNVIQLNLDQGLAMFGDQSFDVVLQIDTLQHLRNARIRGIGIGRDKSRTRSGRCGTRVHHDHGGRSTGQIATVFGIGEKGQGARAGVL